MWNSLPWLQAFSVWTLWIGAGLAGAAVMVSFLSTITANRASNMVQAAANEQIEKARADAAASLAEAAAANERAAAANERTEKLRAQLDWRRLSQEQFDRLTESLRVLRPSLDNNKLSVWVYNSEESSNFASEIFRAIESAGINATGGGINGGPVPFFGVRVDNRHLPNEAQALADALKDASIDTDLGPAPGIASDDPTKLYLWVSVRPPPK